MSEIAPAAPPPADAEHLRMLAIFHYVTSGLAALCACLPLIHLGLGLVMVIAPEKLGPSSNPPPAFIGWFFIIIAAFFILAGWAFAVLVLLAGRFLSARRHYNYCFAMACVECIFMPFGTVLGIFTLLVLLRPSAKAVFLPRPA
jgi:hypothetical protein